MLFQASISRTFSDNKTFKHKLRRHGLLVFEEVLRSEIKKKNNLIGLFKIKCFQQQTLLFFGQINWMEFEFFIFKKYIYIVLK